jgi:anti-anti-sigma regulatory factor
MTTNAEWVQIDAERVLQSLQQEAVDKVNSGAGEVILDFSSVPRIESNAIPAIEQLASLAAGKSVKIVLRAVNGDIYKVLKLLKLTERFGFVTQLPAPCGGRDRDG